MARSFLLVAVLVAAIAMAHVAVTASARRRGWQANPVAPTAAGVIVNITYDVAVQMPTTSMATSGAPMSNKLWLWKSQADSTRAFNVSGWLNTIYRNNPYPIYAFNMNDSPNPGSDNYNVNATSTSSVESSINTNGNIKTVSTGPYTLSYPPASDVPFYSSTSCNLLGSCTDYTGAQGVAYHQHWYEISNNPVTAGANANYQWTFPEGTLFMKLELNPQGQITFYKTYNGYLQPSWAFVVSRWQLSSSNAIAWGNTSRWWFALNNHPDKLGIGLYQLNQWQPNPNTGTNSGSPTLQVLSDNNNFYVRPQFPIEGLTVLGKNITTSMGVIQTPNTITINFAIVFQIQSYLPQPYQ